MYCFSEKDNHDACVLWIKNTFLKRFKSSVAVINMRGDITSNVATALLVEALGANRVICIEMPSLGDGYSGADKFCKYIGANYYRFPIDVIEEYINKAYPCVFHTPCKKMISPRIENMLLYTIANENNGVVVDTTNFSENYICVSNEFLDSCGSISPFGALTETEIRNIARYMKIPDEFLEMSIIDDKIGIVKSNEVDEYIRLGKVGDNIDKIKAMHKGYKPISNINIFIPIIGMYYGN